MKNQRTTIFSMIGVFLALTLACSFSASTAKITDAFTAREVNGAHEATKVFSQNEVFYALVTLENAPDDTATKAVWYAVDAEGIEKNFKIDEAEFTSGDQEVTFNLSNDQLWPIGDYKVELYLNDKLNQTLEFSVEGSAASANTPAGAAAFDAYMVSKFNGGDTQTDVFAPVEPFYLIVDLTNAPADTVSKAAWYAVDVVGAEANSLIDESEFQGNGEVTFDLSNNGLWPTGSYKVEVYINNVLDRTLQFTVAEGTGGASNTNGNTDAVSITSAIIAREMDGEFEETAVYSSDEVFHCYLELSKISPETKFRAEWIAISVDGVAANSSLYVSEGYSQSDAMVFDLSNTNPWAKGKYGVNLYMDEVLQGSLEFSVE